MAASFTLALDTHAPQVTWGEATGLGPGELLRVPFELDEPAMQSATVRLADGRVLTMVVSGSELQLELPTDTPAGDALVSAVVRDDVWNQAAVTTTVRLEGLILPDEPPPPVQPVAPGSPDPDRLRGPRRRLVERRSAARASSTTRVRTVRRERSTAVGTSTRRVDRRAAPPPPQPAPPPAPASSRLVRRRAIAHTGSRTAIAGRAHRRVAAVATSVVTVRKRDDEGVLVLLDLI